LFLLPVATTFSSDCIICVRTPYYRKLANKRVDMCAHLKIKCVYTLFNARPEKERPRTVLAVPCEG
jgi:hypothetical protein